MCPASPRTTPSPCSWAPALLQKLEGTAHGASPIKRLVSRMERWMMKFIRHHGFLGIFLLASWSVALHLCMCV